MSRVALATSRLALPGAGPSIEAHEDVDLPVLIHALATLGVSATFEVWNDADVDWESYDLVVVRSTWGYARHYDEFLGWAHARARLINPFDVIEYSTDKHYLGDLARRGFPVIDTVFCEVGGEATFPEGDFVVKPAVGAGSIDAQRFTTSQRAEAREHVRRLHTSGRCALIQPYVTSIDEHGERALIFIDGEFSHAMTKRAHLRVDPATRDGEFRNKQMARASAEPEAVSVAREILTGRLAGLTYGRVDLVQTPEGWKLMELELAEPALFLGFDEGSPARLARAILSRIP